jgi:hypothetical protein
MTMNHLVKSGAILFIALFALAGCKDPWDSPENQGGKTLITIGGTETVSVRTLSPPDTALGNLTYALSFKGEGEATHEAETLSFGETKTVSLDPGNWTITAQGKDGSRVAAEGSWTGAVSPEDATEVSIILTPKTESGNGDFTYRVFFPSLGEGGSASLSLYAETESGEIREAVKRVTDFSSGEAATVSLPGGFYRLQLNLSKGAKNDAARTAAVHIYPGLDTRGEFVFIEEDFGALPPADKTLSSIAITTPPAKTAYMVGESLDTAGIVVTASYSDGSRAAVRGFTVRGFDSSAAAERQTITVSYTEGSLTKTATFTVSISPPTVSSVAVSPGSVSVVKGRTQQFSAAVNGIGNPAQGVSWSVSGGGSGTSISASGLLTVGANETATTLTVKATSTADTAKSGTAAVTVTAQPPTVSSVTVSPGSVSVEKGRTQQFTATVSGNNNPSQSVNWSVSGGGSGTSINASGLLTVGANETATTLTVRATSTVDTTKSGTAGVTVTTPAATVSSVTVSPGSVSVEKGRTQQFTATVSGSNNPSQSVNWSVSGGGNGTSINASGLLTVGANETATTLTVRATSTVDTTKSGTAAVTVTTAAPSITSVSVSPSSVTVVQGGTQQFTATVSGNNNPSQSVSWSVSGGGSGTSINSSGLLTVAMQETATSLTVRATSTADTTKSGTAAVTVRESTLAQKLAWLQSNAVSNGNYIFEVGTDEGLDPSELSYSGRSNISITLRGRGSERTVSLNSDGTLFTVGSGVTLTLDNNLTLRGRTNDYPLGNPNTSSVVIVNSGGTLVMNTGSKITENTTISFFGGGVVVDGGTFTMNGGTISDNTSMWGAGVRVSSGGTFTMGGGTITGNGDAGGMGGGGGVYVDGGTFTMNGGTISGNGAESGGGVYVGGTFTMRGGSISGNGAMGSGGGVFVEGTFTMIDGTISDNSSWIWYGGGVRVMGTFTMRGGSISGNTVRSQGGPVAGGGGVSVNGYYGYFEKTGGTIYGYTPGDSNSNKVFDSIDVIVSGQGHGVYAESDKYKDSTAGTGVNLMFDGRNSPPTFSGAWDN